MKFKGNKEEPESFGRKFYFSIELFFQKILLLLIRLDYLSKQE